MVRDRPEPITGETKMANAIMVKNNDGYYEMIGAATVEDWSEVQAVADEVEKIDDLTGWGEYTAAYKVQANGGELTYFVAE